MKAISPMEKRSTEYAQDSAKTDGMSKGAATQGAGGSDGNVDALGKRGGQEYAQDCAKTEGLCK